MSRLKIEKLQITIKSIAESSIGCCAGNLSDTICFDYDQALKKLRFITENHLAEVIRKHQFQFEKVIKSAIKGNITVGQKINCVFIDDFTFLNEADYNQFIWLDRRNGELKISSSTKATEGLCRIVADGSFVADTMKSGYGGIVQHINGEREVYCKAVTGGGSNLIELMAVLDGLKQLQSVKEIQVNTDSRFVIRGMVQWMHFWRHNDWQTAYGCRVKFAEYWQQLYRLSEGKFLEFKWIKGYSGHTEQDFCHQLARKSADIS